MSTDMNAFLGNVKQAAIEAVNARKPFAFILGEVTSISPLRIEVDQKFEVGPPQIILTNAVRDFTVSMSTKSEPDTPRDFCLHLALNTGEKVLLLRSDGGQKFIVLDRVEALT